MRGWTRLPGDDYVDCILEDRSGLLWVGSEMESGGLSVLDSKTGRFTRYSIHPQESGSHSVVGVSGIAGLRAFCMIRRTLQTDAAKLRQVALNIARNAVKYTERGSVTSLNRSFKRGSCPARKEPG